MPIGDLLASITGEKPTPSSSTVTRTVLSAPKRKADEELCGTPAKSPRPGLPSNGPSRQGSDLSKPASRLVDNRFLTSSSTGKSVSANRHSDRPAVSSTMKHTRETPSKQMSASSPANGSRSVPVRPSTNRPSPVGSGPKPEPKKRSFAEIMARAKAAQTAAPNLGRIQHKTLDRGVSKKDREEAKAEGGRKPRTATRQDSTRGRGTTSSSRYGTPSSQDQDRQRQGHASSPAGKPLKDKGGKVAAIEEKKVKKAAIATTGYTGTARPRPGAASSKSNGTSSKPSSASRARPQDRRLYGGALSASRRQHEGEDDDLDDFIEYDDEEPAYGYGRGGGYESPEESDMEAGLSDIDQEERRAEYHARREDQEQEALEKRLRREKEEKRRRLLEAARARGR